VAVPRVFISSTYYDLRHIRASLDTFVESFGFESVLSEKGDIAYAHDRPLDESCYAEVANCDILLLIVGGRYGSAASDEALTARSPDFYSRYDSITRKEYERAAADERPVWILVEAGVFAEYQTYKVNKGKTDVRYAHVDSVNVFELIDSIMTQRLNNAASPFTTFSDIESWLRKQWAGLFGELLRRKSGQAELTALASQISEMRDLNQTLKTYMETVVTSVAPDVSVDLIAGEDDKLKARRKVRSAAPGPFITYLRGLGSISTEDAVEITTSSDSLRDLFRLVSKSLVSAQSIENLYTALTTATDEVCGDINELRSKFDKLTISRIQPTIEDRQEALALLLS
jgi:Domain of unknown function (DUF4062)